MGLAIAGVAVMTAGVAALGVVPSSPVPSSSSGGIKPRYDYELVQESKGSDPEDDGDAFDRSERGIHPHRKRGGGGGGGFASLSPRTQGLCLALYVGVANGSFMVPFKAATKDTGLDAVEYTLSFGMGSAGITALLMLLYLNFSGTRRPSLTQWRVALRPGLLTGLLWSAGNFCSIIATQMLDLTIAWPMVQVRCVCSFLSGFPSSLSLSLSLSLSRSRACVTKVER